MNIFFNNITKTQQKRTKKLLYYTRKKYGIDIYLVLKAILIPPMISEYYQSHGYPNLWVNYERVLKRNEELFKKEMRMYNLLQCNVFGSPEYFGVPIHIIKQCNVSKIINISINHWNEALNNEYY